MYLLESEISSVIGNKEGSADGILDSGVLFHPNDTKSNEWDIVTGIVKSLNELKSLVLIALFRS